MWGIRALLLLAAGVRSPVARLRSRRLGDPACSSFRGIEPPGGEYSVDPPGIAGLLGF